MGFRNFIFIGNSELQKISYDITAKLAMTSQIDLTRFHGAINDNPVFLTRFSNSGNSNL